MLHPQLVADLREEAYYAALEAEHEKLLAIPRVKGCEAVELDGTCEGCNTVQPILYARDCYTLGYVGHPGAEITVFHICADCLNR